MANIQRMCFTPEGLLFKEFDLIFHDLFSRRDKVYREIVAALVNGSLDLEGLYAALGVGKTGKIGEYSADLVQAGFLSRDYTWDLKTADEGKHSKLRLSDNYRLIGICFNSYHKTRIANTPMGVNLENRQTRLKANTIGPWGLAALAIGITSPAMGLYALWGPMQVAAGPITPLIFLAAMLMTLPTAISYALLNREAPSAGAASTWLWTAVHPLAGYLAGLLMTTYFAMAAIAQPLMFALFFHDLLDWLHFTWPEPITLSVGVLLASAPVAWVCLRGAEASVKTTVQLMVVETLVVVALSATILVNKSSEPGAITLSAFDPHQGTSLPGFWAAMILGVLAYCGFDVVSTAAEEAHAPREHLPKAILLTIIGMAFFWAANAWVFTLSTPVQSVRDFTSHGLTAVTPIAQAYWGWGNLIVIATAFTGLTAVYISSMQGASRIVFALARHGLLPKFLARLSGERRVPRNAVLSLLAAVIFLDLGSLYVLDSGLDSFTWWANALVFFATLTFLAVNLANSFLFWRFAQPQFRLLQNLVLPVLGVMLNLYLIYAAFFCTLWAGDVRTGKSVVMVCVALLAVQIGALIYMRLCMPHLLTQGTPIGVDSAAP